MHLSVATNIASVAPSAWNRAVGTDNPFVRHEFLAALEASGSVGAARGWRPQHLLLHSEAPGRGVLLGCVPLYLKDHSYGEYVFDWAWAEAYRRAGLAYYPKLVAAVPFTPVTGPRLLVAPDAPPETRARLVEGARALAEELNVSSLHWLFADAADTALLEQSGLLRRDGYQFHWHNRGYRDFDDFLAGFSAVKRKKVRRERRQVREAGITLAAAEGTAIGPELWDSFYDFYLATIEKHGAHAYLTRAFFRELSERLPESLVLIVARRNNDCLAAAFFVRGADTLYGRYWGTRAAVPGLHFETCYYAAIDYCIAHGLARFEAGAQGEHKLTRGFLPTPTYSAHWLRHPEFNRAVEDFLRRERRGVDMYIDELDRHSPFKKAEIIISATDEHR